jgi:hypothetical protein
MVGKQIRTLINDYDTDECGNERLIPKGTVGLITDLNSGFYTIEWENGGVTMWTGDEIDEDAEVL